MGDQRTEFVESPCARCKTMTLSCHYNCDRYHQFRQELQHRLRNLRKQSRSSDKILKRLIRP